MSNGASLLYELGIMMVCNELQDLMTKVIKRGGILEKRFGEVLRQTKKIYIPVR